MAELAIIGGTGLTALDGLDVVRREDCDTPYGRASGPLTHGVLGGKEVIFLARHGYSHTIPPHKINYRANIWALHSAGVKKIVAVAAVGGIHRRLKAAQLVIPDQLIDYTWGRASTFFEDDLAEVTHIDFTDPYSENLRQLLMSSCESLAINAEEQGVYGATQGPRLETAAEIARMERDGCTLVGMTGMPEAALARELGLEYVCCAVIANMAAGKSDGEISMQEIERNVLRGVHDVRRLLANLIFRI
ncbi:MAG: S-methyl-5'-thioinosine phosphorylase [Gammaproteobacteria bacterium]|nr:S-methyl-5'-thioinosine phosphorylase [Gammaproteobacteria bacterium]